MDPETSQLAAEVERCIWTTIVDTECANFPLASGCSVFAFSTARHGKTSLREAMAVRTVRSCRLLVFMFSGPFALVS